MQFEAGTKRETPTLLRHHGRISTTIERMAKPEELAREKLVPVFSTQNELEAGMVQDLLRNAGIESLISGRLMPSHFPLNVGRLATREILVLESEAGTARRIIAEQHESGGEEAG